MPDKEHLSFVHKSLEDNLVPVPVYQTVEELPSVNLMAHARDCLGPNGPVFAQSLVSFLNKYGNANYKLRIKKEFDDYTGFNYLEINIVRNKKPSMFSRKPVIAKIDNCGGKWRKNYSLMMFNTSSDEEKKLMILWDSIRKEYIPKGFPIEEAFWLKDIKEIRRAKGLYN